MPSRLMSAHIVAHGTLLPQVLLDEMAENVDKVNRYSDNDWPPDEKEKVKNVISAEREIVNGMLTYDMSADSVHGDFVMPSVYSGYSGKKTDVITKRGDLALVLSEAKYLIKVGGVGPFGGPAGFRERVSDKFHEIQQALAEDGETVDPLRIIIETEEQLPYSIQSVSNLVNGEYDNANAFSTDGQKHRYVLCSSKNLRRMIEDPPVGTVSEDYFFFTL